MLPPLMHFSVLTPGRDSGPGFARPGRAHLNHLRPARPAIRDRASSDRAATPVDRDASDDVERRWRRCARARRGVCAGLAWAHGAGVSSCSRARSAAHARAARGPVRRARGCRASSWLTGLWPTRARCARAERVGMMQRMASANDLAQLNSDAWAKNKSYTDLAALATGYEAERPRSRTGSDVGGSSDERALTLYAQAMELINAGLKLVRAHHVPSAVQSPAAASARCGALRRRRRRSMRCALPAGRARAQGACVRAAARPRGLADARGPARRPAPRLPPARPPARASRRT